MSDTERIPVPTNGHRKPLASTEPAIPQAGPAPALPQPASDLTPSVSGTGDRRIVITPGQLAAGFGIVAGVILLLVGSRRRGKRG